MTDAKPLLEMPAPCPGETAPAAVPERDTVALGPKTVPIAQGPDRPAAGLSRVPGYEDLEVLGRGSMGVVYKARQTGLGRQVAIKMILADTWADQEALQRFTTEARALASLRHPNIVQIYEINLDHRPAFFAMELVEGTTLADRLGGRPQPARTAAQLIQKLSRAVDIAHQTGIVHRDLKPGNILIPTAAGPGSSADRLRAELGLDPPDAAFGEPKITDFGLAKDLHADNNQTESGVIMGTPNYMSPEQAEGKSRDVGPAADVYALGAILYEMLTGRPPFTAESRMDTLLLLFHADPVPPSRLQPKIPKDLETICLKCLHKAPRRRYATAGELADDLGRFLTGESIQARPATVWEKAVKWGRRRPALAASIAGSLLAAVGLLGVGAWHQFDLEEQLGVALQNERDSREAEAAAAAREQMSRRTDQAGGLADAAEAALAANDWAGARVHLARAKETLGDEPEPADVRARVEMLQVRADRQKADLERLARFQELRNDALFHATLFTGAGTEAAGRDTRTAATEALTLFATKPATDSPFYTDRQKADVAEGRYELLIVLADAEADAEAAIRTLDRAAALRTTTQAYHRRRAAYLDRAGKAEAAGERAKADQLRPSTALDHFLLGLDMHRAGNAKQAVASFESALQLRPDHFWARYYLGLSWLRGGRPDQTVTCLTACLAQRQEFPWLYLLRASAWAEQGQYDRAETDFETAAGTKLSESARYGLLINRGVMRVRQGKLDAGAADLREAVALRPGQYQGHMNLAQAHVKAREFDAALARLDEAVRLEPGLASLYRTRARVRLLRKEPAAALADFDEAIRREPTADDHLDRGRILHARKNYAGALDAAKAAAALRPKDPQSARLRAEALVGLDRPTEALKALDECLASSPTDAGAYRARAALRTRAGQYAGAQSDFTRALEIDPDAATYSARGWCYVVSGAPKLAAPDFDEAVRRAPNDGDAYAGRGYVRALLGQTELAVEDAVKASSCGPESSRLHYNIARVYAQALNRRERTPYIGTGGGYTRPDWEDRGAQALARAVQLLPAAEAAAFWQNVVAPDRVLEPLRRTPGFARLSATYPASPPLSEPR